MEKRLRSINNLLALSKNSYAPWRFIETTMKKVLRSINNLLRSMKVHSSYYQKSHLYYEKTLTLHEGS